MMATATLRVPRRQMALAGRLLAEVHVHDRGAGVERGLRLARHLVGRDRHVMLLRDR